MEKIIKQFNDGSFLKYDKGTFDNWCVYFVDNNEKKTAPKDIYFFKKLLEFSEKYGCEKIYKDFTTIYDITGKEISDDSLETISKISMTYGEDSLEIDILFSALYMTMISEENKKNTKLGKRIKRLGVHRLLIEKNTINESANFMKGMSWTEIDTLCRNRNF